MGFEMCVGGEGDEWYKSIEEGRRKNILLTLYLRWDSDALAVQSIVTEPHS